jgi:cytochrome c553
MPELAGEEADEIFEELLEFRARPANANVMHVQARGYTDAQLLLIADFFSKQPD